MKTIFTDVIKLSETFIVKNAFFQKINSQDKIVNKYQLFNLLIIIQVPLNTHLHNNKMKVLLRSIYI